MNKLTIAATALLLASTAAAHAGSAISFKVDGQNVRVERPRHCASLDCLTVVAPGLSDKPIKLNNLKDLNGSKDKNVDTTPAPAATTAPPAPAPVQQAPIQATAPTAPAAPAPVTTVTAAPSVGFANNAQPAPVAAPAPPAAPAPVAAAPAPVQVAAAPAAAPTSPIGVWATEDNKGNVRIEQCGANLCGFAEKGNERILIDMKPEGAKWSGHIRDPRNDKNYDSTFALKSPNALRVQGCALGGLICGGETWQRVS